MSKIKSLKEFNSNLPNMSQTIIEWFLPISFDIVQRVLVGADWEIDTNKTVTVNTRGVVRPPKDEELAFLPEGTWSWDWLQLHCLPDKKLSTNQFIKYDDVVYKVMATKDYSKYGYMRYTILEAYQAEMLT